MNLLVVDDEPLEIEQLTFIVKKEYPEWNIYEAEDVVEAKRLLTQHFFPLAFIDINLPGDSGLDLCKHISEREYATAVVLITAHQEFSYAHQAIRLDVMDYLVKPVIERELYQVIHHFLDKHSYIDTKSDLVNSVLTIVRKEYSQKLQLPEIAKQVYVTPVYLSKKFTEEVGVNFTEYVMNFRIQKAKQLIKEKPYSSIAQISEEVGFSSQHHFSNSFKKVEGMTPSKFKENCL
ncbi:response regulator [Aquibacillus sp. 3ASR75-11]|uniref:Response regulator n=1 Tax=Terrihalobacillus insolitus TaxID=2950438 RepID=A0A9X3WR74_9BACI|nr:response regulator [Terrihalobacillus insolitus]MDC3412094.1 response regulator [Terrihalobacillus insolitus]MDC3423213.1 response regulator [Terrihalobacillus insolitus]